MVNLQNLFDIGYDTSLPGDPLPFNSRFYIERPPLEKYAYEEISKPGGLLRIRASQKMGKSSLILRLIHQARNQGYYIVNIDFKQADRQTFKDTNKFLRWLCVNVARQLSMIPNINNYWDEDIGCKMSATIYFEDYILETINQPIFLVLNELHYVFRNAHIAQEFLPLLRSWYELAKQSHVWMQLRLALVYSTEVYVPLNVNQSPFNVGLSLKVAEFNSEQVMEFARRYELKSFSLGNARKLMELVGGHPYLIHLSLYHLQRDEISFSQLLATAGSYDGIYSNYLRDLFTYLQINPELLQAYNQIIISQSQHNISVQIMYKLDSLGLIKKGEDHTFQPACEMYRLFFEKEHLSISNNNSRIQKLEAENQELKFLVNVDSLTKVANRRYFDNYFHSEWKKMEYIQQPISLILADVDKFKNFNDTYGHQAGDECLYHVAQLMSSVIMKNSGNLVARYGGEEFAVILPQTDAKGAMLIAEEVRKTIKLNEVKIPVFGENNNQENKVKITISLGVACIIPQLSFQPEQLLASVDQALYQAKQTGRDRVILSSSFCYFK
ncbi:MAG: diguanylate cyclase [Sphaerospermopsis sp. SIO1G1]|nr:diguanylate cyclase [Sphaerospermopsis sp. SIO1G1]